MNTKEAKLCYEIVLLYKQQTINESRGIDKKFPEKARIRQRTIDKLTDRLLCLGLDQYEE